MRFIHTSDWHIGKGIRGKDRYDEARALLDEIATYSETESIDLVIIAGDLFDHPTPASEAEKVVYSFFSRMNRSSVPIVVIAGNHDSYERFDSRSDLFSIANVNVFGTPRRNAVHSLVTKTGQKAIIGCLPYLSPRFLLKANEIFELTEGEMKAGYSEKVGKAISILSRQFSPGAVNILVSHLFLQRAVPSSTERRADTTDLYAVTAPAIPAGAQYCCLGHIHKQQRLERASAPAYYCGSIMKLDFGEDLDEKGFLVVEAEAEKAARVEFIPLQQVVPVFTIEVEFSDLANRAEEIRKAFANSYGRIRIRHKQPIPNLSEIIKHEIPEAVAWDIVLPGSSDEKRTVEKVELRQLMDPVEMFATFCREEFDREPSELHVQTMRRLYESALREDHEEEQ